MSASTQFSGQEIWNRCYDPVTHEVRAFTSEANPPASTALQFQVILNAIFDENTNRLVFD